MLCFNIVKYQFFFVFPSSNNSFSQIFFPPQIYLIFLCLVIYWVILFSSSIILIIFIFIAPKKLVNWLQSVSISLLFVFILCFFHIIPDIFITRLCIIFQTFISIFVVCYYFSHLFITFWGMTSFQVPICLFCSQILSCAKIWELFNHKVLEFFLLVLNSFSLFFH